MVRFVRIVLTVLICLFVAMIAPGIGLFLLLGIADGYLEPWWLIGGFFGFLAIVWLAYWIIQNLLWRAPKAGDSPFMDRMLQGEDKDTE